MSGKKLIILFVILVAVGSLYVWDQNKIAEEEAKEEEAKELFSWETDDVEALTLKSLDETINLKKTGGAWRIVNPVDADADQAEVDRIVERFGEAKHERIANEEASELRSFGLDPAKHEVIFEDGEGKSLGSVKIGDEIPTKSFYFATIDDASKVITLKAMLNTTVDKTLFDIRDKTVMDVTEDKVRRIAVEYSDGTSLVASGTNELDWKLEQPFQAVGEWDEIAKLVRKIDGLKVKEFVAEEPEDVSPYGLIDDVTRLTVTEEDRAEPRTLLIGSLNESKSTYFAKMANRDNIFTIDKTFVTALPKEPFDWRPQKPLNIWSYNANRVDIEDTVSGKTLTFAKDDKSKWALQQPEMPEGSELDNQKVNELVDDLHGFDVIRYVTDTVDMDVTGLAAPSYIITVSGTDKIKKLLLGKEDSDRFLVYGKRDTNHEVFVGRNSLLKKITKPYTEYFKAPAEATDSETQSMQEIMSPPVSLEIPEARDLIEPSIEIVPEESPELSTEQIPNAT